MKFLCPSSLRFFALACCFLLLPVGSGSLLEARPAQEEAIKAYCLDFNWAPTHRRGRPIATPGQWANADPAEHVAWYEDMGANVIQTFAVSTNGHAWYKDSFAPEQPGLKHDFLPEMVKLGHDKGMKVFGYFTVGTNPVWAKLKPDQSYGVSRTYHIPYTNDYLDYLSESIHDAVSKTGIDGFMIDWVWMPKRESTGGKWIESEKELYQQLMGEVFPGEDKLTKMQDIAYSRKAIDRCWQTIKKAAKSANPDCIIWLTVNKMHHPHVTNSNMYKEVDWLMNEAGSVEAVLKAKPMVGEHTRLITCLAAWNGADASKIVPAAIAEGIGLYGFTTPLSKNGIVKLERIFEKQVTELSGDNKNIATLARAYRGKSEHAIWREGEFLEPETPPSFRLMFKRRGRGLQDTARVEPEEDITKITVKTPYERGEGTLRKIGEKWPKSIVIQLQKKPGVVPEQTTHVAITDGATGAIIHLDQNHAAYFGAIDTKAKIDRRANIRFKLTDTHPINVNTKKHAEYIRITIPNELLDTDPGTLTFQWGKITP
jgi:hypothetical protein